VTTTTMMSELARRNARQGVAAPWETCQLTVGRGMPMAAAEKRTSLPGGAETDVGWRTTRGG
jgi:hypothetical protein